MSDVSDDERINVPEVAVCEARCKEFAELTSTDTACAMFFLQDTDWDVSRAVNAYFDSMPMEEMPQKTNGPIAATILEFVAASPAASVVRPGATGDDQSRNLPLKSFRFMTWNVDGLGEMSRELRIKRVCEIIKCEQPLVVHLQEVTSEVNSYLKKHLPNDYKLISGNAEPGFETYYAMTLLKKDAVDYESHEILEFPGTSMDRNLLMIKVRAGDVPFLFLNSHFESTAEFANERKRQLSTAFKKLMKCDTSTTVIFAGDLNLRDKELDAIGGLPAGVEDLWISTGRREELKYTWDAQRNSNINLPNSYARCRFDRIYLRQASPSRLTIKHFGFVGLEKIADCGRFPSDHWGLVAHFDIQSDN